jgi:hypothetical protein
VRTQYNRLLSGEQLSPAQRADFVHQGQLLFGEHQRQYGEQAVRYRDLATRYGADPDEVAIAGAAPVRQPAARPAAPATPDIPQTNSSNVKTVGGKKYRKTAGGWELVP